MGIYLCDFSEILSEALSEIPSRAFSEISNEARDPYRLGKTPQGASPSRSFSRVGISHFVRDFRKRLRDFRKRLRDFRKRLRDFRKSLQLGMKTFPESLYTH
jgi:hypothetical protein